MVTQLCHSAAIQGHIECLKELIAAGADINKEDKDGRTALWTAANQGHIECLKELIAAGADINKEDKDGEQLCGLLQTKAVLNV